MATGSYMTPTYSRSQSEVQGDLHNGAQRINPENRVGSSFRIIPEQYFSGIENIDDFLENIDHNLAYYEIPAQLATAKAGSDVVQSGRPIFDDFFQHLWPYIGNNTANVVFQLVKRLWLIRIDQ
ncbi:hypothetical protein TNCV_2455991 [Trichonephila clavipes]|nr:hypothetical protein TNCV_2455991 [Trichonephila clavipes]